MSSQRSNVSDVPKVVKTCTRQLILALPIQVTMIIENAYMLIVHRSGIGHTDFEHWMFFFIVYRIVILYCLSL